MPRRKQLPTLQRLGESRDLFLSDGAVIKIYEDGLELVKNGWVVAEYTNNILRLLACNRVVVTFEINATLHLMEVLASKDINEMYEHLLNIGAKEIN